ncbi:MAG: hypothetical protein C0614_07450 [Desulfuromonas sp.]|nr:MAG: hypothetical protein C0614_07450 [Desulfuromonas sp.]
MGLRIFIFEEDSSLLNLLTVYLQGKGHSVQGFLGRYSCPLYQKEHCCCPAEKPCAEAVIINSRNPLKDADILIDQGRKGCKLAAKNKAVMCASFLKGQEDVVQDLGFSTIKKPFRLEKIEEWLESCTARLSCQLPASPK